MSDIIYYICGESTFSKKLNVQGVKIGSTRNIYSRVKTYQTGYPDTVPLTCYYKINANCYDVDNKIKCKFNDIRLNTLGSTGGTEFYSSNILTEEALESFFEANNIQWEKLYPDSILAQKCADPITYDDIINVNHDFIQKQEADRINNQYKITLKSWQKDLVTQWDQFIDSNEKAGLIIAPTGCGKSFMMNYLSIFHWICKTNNDVIIMTKRKEILDLDFIAHGNHMISLSGKKIKIVNLIDSGDYEDFVKSSLDTNYIYIINTDKFIMSPKFSGFKKYSWGNIKLLIMDECHWAGADKLSEFLLWAKTNILDKIVGFSATPVRYHLTNQTNSKKIYSSNANPNEYNVIYSRSYIDSINEKDRTETKWLLIPVTTSDLNTVTYKNSEPEGDTNTESKIIVEHVLNTSGFKKFTSWLNVFIVNSNNKKGILWFPNTANLKAYWKFVCAEKSQYSNINQIEFFPTYSKKDDLDVSANLVNFKKKKTHGILLAVFRATEGFDDITIDFGFNLFITNNVNPLLDQQKEGRVSRCFPGKSVGYFGFLYNQAEQDYAEVLVKRLGNWINYIKSFENENEIANKTKKPKPSNYTTNQYIDLILDSANIKCIDYTSIKNKIFNYCENFTGSVGDIKRIIQKENKARLIIGSEPIDTKSRYTQFAQNLEAWPKVSDIKVNNLVELFRPDFDVWIKQFYTWDELKQFCSTNLIGTIDEFIGKTSTDVKVPSYEYITSGIYNTSKKYMDINEILYDNEDNDMYV